MTLYETAGRVVVRERVDGLYSDRWSVGGVNYQRFACEGGTVAAHLTSSVTVHRRPVTVTATADGKQYKAVVGPNAPNVLRVPVRPERRVCFVTYTVPTVVPSMAYGTGDERGLGVQFSFVYEPPE